MVENSRGFFLFLLADELYCLQVCAMFIHELFRKKNKQTSYTLRACHAGPPVLPSPSDRISAGAGQWAHGSETLNLIQTHQPPPV